jgi:hypothetical protein
MVATLRSQPVDRSDRAEAFIRVRKSQLPPRGDPFRPRQPRADSFRILVPLCHFNPRQTFPRYGIFSINSPALLPTDPFSADLSPDTHLARPSGFAIPVSVIVTAPPHPDPTLPRAMIAKASPFASSRRSLLAACGNLLASIYRVCDDNPFLTLQA